MLTLEDEGFSIFPHSSIQASSDTQIVERTASGDKRGCGNAEQFPALDVCDCIHDVNG